jgi:hypothetical protein
MSVFLFEGLNESEEDSEVDEELYNLVKRLQIHAHKESCKTKVKVLKLTVCRDHLIVGGANVQAGETLFV